MAKFYRAALFFSFFFSMNQARWIQRLLVACDGDYNLASRHLFWLKEKVVEDSRGKKISARNNPLTSQEEKHLEDLIEQRVSDHKPLQYILGRIDNLHLVFFFFY